VRIVCCYLEYSYFRREKSSLSKTKFVAYAARGFWAYDVALNVFLKHLIDAAQASDQADTPWLFGAISDWRVGCIPDHRLELDASWSPAQRQTFCILAEQACATLAGRELISAEEIVSWQILEDLELYTRGETEVSTGPVIELGRAIIALMSGHLPDAPEGQIWLYGAPEDRITIGWEARSFTNGP
jgi:hypothetical protein